MYKRCLILWGGILILEEWNVKWKLGLWVFLYDRFLKMSIIYKYKYKNWGISVCLILNLIFICVFFNKC